MIKLNVTSAIIKKKGVIKMMEKYGKVDNETYEVVDIETKEVKATTSNMEDALEALEKNANCKVEVKGDA